MQAEINERGNEKVSSPLNSPVDCLRSDNSFSCHTFPEDACSQNYWIFLITQLKWNKMMFTVYSVTFGQWIDVRAADKAAVL